MQFEVQLLQRYIFHEEETNNNSFFRECGYYYSSFPVSNTDTLDGRWVLKINKQEAVESGVSEEFYELWITNMNEVNDFNENLRKEDPDIVIHFNLPL